MCSRSTVTLRTSLTARRLKPSTFHPGKTRLRAAQKVRCCLWSDKNNRSPTRSDFCAPKEIKELRSSQWLCPQKDLDHPPSPTQTPLEADTLLASSPCNPSPSSFLSSLWLPPQLDRKSLKIHSVLVLVNTSFSKHLVPGQLECSFTGRVYMKKTIGISQLAPNSYFEGPSLCSPLAFPRALKHFMVYLEFWDCVPWHISSLIGVVSNYNVPHPERQ